MKPPRRLKIGLVFAACLVALAARLRAEDADLAKQLENLEARILENPKDPMLSYRKAQALMKAGKHNEGYAVAKEAMEKFKASGKELAWMLLESIPLEKVRVDVHFNMGERERNPPQLGIIRPLSFRVWSNEGERRLVEIIDFEIGMFDGKPDTAALGIQQAKAHGTFTMLKPDASYPEVRDAALKLIKERQGRAQQAK